MYQNDIFYFLKIIFEINTLKRSKTYKNNNFLQKNFNFLGTRCKPRSQTRTKFIL
jgi:hypothetical protein